MEQYQAYGNLIFDDINIADYNAFAFYCNVLDRPVRDVEVVSVPGRNGDIIIDNGRYKNVDRVYQIQATDLNNIKALVSALVSKHGYFRLEDDYEPEYYFRARLKSAPKISRFQGAAASIQLIFDRMPQKYLKSSEDIGLEATQIDKDFPLGNPPSRTPTGDREFPVVMYRVDAPNYTDETFYPIIEVTPAVYVKRVAIFWDYGMHTAVGVDDLWDREDAIYIENKDESLGIPKFTIDCETGALDIQSVSSRNMVIGTNGLIKIKPGTNYIHFVQDNHHTSGGSYVDADFVMTAKVYERRWEI